MNNNSSNNNNNNEYNDNFNTYSDNTSKSETVSNNFNGVENKYNQQEANPYASSYGNNNSSNNNPYSNMYTNNTPVSNGYSNPYSNQPAQPQQTNYSPVESSTQNTGYNTAGNNTPNSNGAGANGFNYDNGYQSVAQQAVVSKTKDKKGGKGALKLIIAALCFGLIAGGTMLGVNHLGNSMLGGDTTATGGNKNNTSSTIKNSSGGVVTTTYDVASVVDNVMPSMVSINVKATTEVENPYSDFFDSFGGFGGFGGFGNYGGDTYEYETEGSGSGIIISQNDSELLIVTNNHVIEGANKISVSFIDGKSCSATIKGTDADYDLAVIAVKLSDIESETKKDIAVATLGNSESLKLGQPAVAIGNALGYGQSVTVGYISALERDVQLTDNTMSLIQTDAAINPGNSGGALLDMNGNVIGINSAKYSDTDVEGMGYAIPISDASPIIDDLINQTVIPESKQAYLGISGIDVTDSYAESFGLPKGVYVSQVNSNSPAYDGGIHAGDVIVKFDGRDINSMQSLQSRLKTKSAGEKVEIVVKRQQVNGDFKEIKLTITLGAKSDAPSQD